jgi:hypothetical protein
MSRTDKDRPLRVRIRDASMKRVEAHDHRNGECDLHEWLADYSDDGWNRYGGCDMDLLNAKWFDEPTREDRRNGWFGPIRTRDRDDAIRMRKEFNSSGTVDDEVWLPRDHRHSCFNGGWWN